MNEGLDRTRHAIPHILFITCHDLGRYLGCYGVHTVQSPRIDSLAREGVRFTRAFSTASGCSPARAALATGRYPHSTGVLGLAHPPFNWTLGADQRHLAALLGDAGYETHLFGLQHVSMRAETLGFHWIHPFREKAWSRSIAEQVGEFLRSSPPEKPLYLEVNLEEVHRPYDEYPVSDASPMAVDVQPYLPDDIYSREELMGLQAAVRDADAGVDGILAALDEAGLGDNTIVVFTVDHGIAMPRAKCTLYDPGIEVALLMRWRAGGLVGGRVHDDLLSSIDILPTLLDLVGAPKPEYLQGQSFLALLRGDQYTPRREVFAEKTFHSYYDPMRAIRTDRYKFIRNFETTFAVEVPGDVQLGSIFRHHVELYHGSEHAPVELYDLDDDPMEQRNVAGAAPYADAERWLDRSLWTWMEQSSDPLIGGPVASPSYRQARESKIVNDSDD